MPSNILLWLVIGALAAYRISLMFAKESGPAFIFRKLRRLPPPKSATKEGLACQWCLSVYSSAFVCALFLIGGLRLQPALWIAFWLAVSAGAIAMNQAFTKGR